ncbi:MAG: glycosyltransferase [Blautia sp.]|jgi:glycosyltransferase involved in cell wall biosynthesis
MNQEMKDDAYSVLMSVYEKEKPEYLAQSVESMLRQTLPPDDFVIVCDGPLGEELDKVIEGFDREHPGLFQIVRLPKCGGLGNALNEGMRYCRFEKIARMDSDDISMEDRCRRQLAAMEEHQADIVGGTLYEFEGDISKIRTRRISPETPEEILRYARRRNPFNHPCVMYRRQAVEAAGGYRHCPWFEDYDLWSRMLLSGSRGYNVQEPVLYMRAGEAMYARRGGFAYGRQALRFRWSLKKRGLSSWMDFLISGGGQFVVSVMPNGLRKKFYGKVLRKEVPKNNGER